MKKTYLINDLVWITLAVFACAGGLKLGFGSFHQPQAGFMPFLAGLLMGALALIDLASGWINRWKEARGDREIWSGIDWRRIGFTMGLLFCYALLASTLGFIVGTILLLIILFRMMERRPWWVIAAAAFTTTGLFYFIFKIGLESQLPRGLWGF